MALFSTLGAQSTGLGGLDFHRLLQALIIGLAIAITSVVFVHRGTSLKAIAATAVCAAGTVLVFTTWYPEGMAGFHQGVGLAAGSQMIGF